MQTSSVDAISITREVLSVGLSPALLASMPAGMRVRTDAELRESLHGMLRDHASGDDVYVFGYGSLMWNPAIECVDVMPAKVAGWHRRFCLRLIFGRGSTEMPGAMLGLDRGGSCRGVLLRISTEKAIEELLLLWRREMSMFAYEARWVTAVSGNTRFRALTFVVNKSHGRYIGSEPIDQIAKMICTGHGVLGSCRSYFDETLRALARLGVTDIGMARIQKAIAGIESDTASVGCAR